MRNYIKSEFYRVIHTRDIYLTAGVLASLVLLMHAGIYFFGGQYKTTSFSYSNLVANPMAFAIMGAIIAFVLYEGNRRNGNLKNTIASGISREKIFFGECVVSTVVSTILMILILGLWILCTEYLLEDHGPVRLVDLLMEIPASYLIAVACLISTILFLEVLEKNISSILVWLAIWFLIPKILLYAGMRFEAVYQVAMWLPDNIFGITRLHVNTQECITVWDTAEGIVRCILSGGIGVILFFLMGILLLRKKDL